VGFLQLLCLLVTILLISRACLCTTGSETFPEHPLLVDEFGRMFCAVQLNAEQFFVNALLFIGVHVRVNILWKNCLII